MASLTNTSTPGFVARLQDILIDEAFAVKLSKYDGLPGVVETEEASVFVNLALGILFLRWVNTAVGFFDESVPQDRAVLARQSAGSRLPL